MKLPAGLPEIEVLRYENARLRLAHGATQTALQTVLLLPWTARLRFLVQGARMFEPPEDPGSGIQATRLGGH